MYRESWCDHFRRNAIIIRGIELMLNAVNLLLVGFSKYWGDGNVQSICIFIMTVAAAEVAVGLAIHDDLPESVQLGHRCTQPDEMVI